MVPYGIRRTAWPLLLEELELSTFLDASRRPIQKLSALRARLTWAKLRGYLRRSLPSFDACTVVSAQEKLNVAAAAPGASAVRIVPNAVAAHAYDSDIESPQPASLIFPGALTYDANLLGARWFLASVFPKLREQIPAVHLRITGSHAGVDLTPLQIHPGCEFTGYVPDIRPVIAQSLVTVVPLQTGGGTRLKILESMALGTPVVSTSKGAEGLSVTHGDNILIADDPAEFAEHVAAIVGDQKLRARLASGGRALVKSQYDWDVVGPRFCKIAEQAVASRTSRKGGGLG
jgi:glycosyltransferase involved in cell wall biosynthesis